MGKEKIILSFSKFIFAKGSQNAVPGVRRCVASGNESAEGSVCFMQTNPVYEAV